MKIKKDEVYYIEHEEDSGTYFYVRFADESWYLFYGESLEPEYHSESLEKEFQKELEKENNDQ